MIEDRAPPDPEILFSARSLTVMRDAVVLVRDADLVLRTGELAWIAAPSGSGKSTLLRSLARLVPIPSGTLALGAADAGSLPAHLWRAQVALVPSPPAVVGATLAEDLLVPFRLRVRRSVAQPDDECLSRSLAGFGLGDLALGRPTDQLSQGQLARVALLRVLLTEPQVLLLDEPAANLDPAAEALVEDRIRAHLARGNAALVAAHTAPWTWAARRYRIRGRLLEET